MTTDEEKVAAVQAALEALPTADRQNSVKRFVAQWNALAPFLPTPEPLPEQQPEATLLVSFKPTDEMLPDYKRISDELLAMVQKVKPAAPSQRAPTEQSPAPEAAAENGPDHATPTGG